MTMDNVSPLPLGWGYRCCHLVQEWSGLLYQWPVSRLHTSVIRTAYDRNHLLEEHTRNMFRVDGEGGAFTAAYHQRAIKIFCPRCFVISIWFQRRHLTRLEPLGLDLSASGFDCYRCLRLSSSVVVFKVCSIGHLLDDGEEPEVGCSIWLGWVGDICFLVEVIVYCSSTIFPFQLQTGCSSSSSSWTFVLHCAKCAPPVGLFGLSELITACRRRTLDIWLWPIRLTFSEKTGEFWFQLLFSGWKIPLWYPLLLNPTFSFTLTKTSFHTFCLHLHILGLKEPWWVVFTQQQELSWARKLAVLGRPWTWISGMEDRRKESPNEFLSNVPQCVWYFPSDSSSCVSGEGEGEALIS